jgi:hypothetical protein
MFVAKPTHGEPITISLISFCYCMSYIFLLSKHVLIVISTKLNIGLPMALLLRGEQKFSRQKPVTTIYKLKLPKQKTKAQFYCILCVYIYTGIYIYMYVCSYMYIFIYIHIHICTYTHTYTVIHIHIHIHIHT